MSRRGPHPWKAKRQKVTLNIDTRAYRAVREVVDQAPGLSVSDLVSELLLAVVDEMKPVIEALVKAKNHTERIALIESYYAEQSGQLALEFARTYSALLAVKEDDETS
jgi:hypothetical protein